VLRWAREQGCPWNNLTCHFAAWGGHLAVLKWAREHDCPWDESTCSRPGHGVLCLELPGLTARQILLATSYNAMKLKDN